LHRGNSVEAITKDLIAEFIEGWRLDDEELKTLLDEGIVELA
jgi:hypothetical protein